MSALTQDRSRGEAAKASRRIKMECDNQRPVEHQRMQSIAQRGECKSHSSALTASPRIAPGSRPADMSCCLDYIDVCPEQLEISRRPALVRCMEMLSGICADVFSLQVLYLRRTRTFYHGYLGWCSDSFCSSRSQKSSHSPKSAEPCGSLEPERRPQ
jgi:hypothetical protein